MLRALMLSAAALIALPAAAQDIAITNAKLVIGDASAPIDGGTVVVRGGKVVAAGARIAVPAAVETVHARGRYLPPGTLCAPTRDNIVAGMRVTGRSDIRVRRLSKNNRGSINLLYMCTEPAVQHYYT